MQTTGVIVAGGKSRRMGSDKALLVFRGKSLLDHAISLLSCIDVDQTIILGRPGTKHGITDPLPGAGPAANLVAWINRQSLPLRVIVLPVDMPLLTIDQIQALTNCKDGAYFDDLYLPLAATITSPLPSHVVRMKDLLKILALDPVPISEKWQKALTNVNSVEDFADLNPS